MPTHSRWIIVLVLILVSATAQMVSAMTSADTAQTWYLTSVNKPDDAPTANDSLHPYAADNLMHKDGWAGDGTRFELKHSKPAAWFYADTDAECELGFGGHSWKAYIRTEKIDGGEIGTHLQVSVCKLDAGGTVTVLAEGAIELTAADAYTLWEVTCEDVEGTQDFNAGDWLAVRLLWTDVPESSSEKLLIYYKAATDKDSYITFPSSDPGYPVPELPTLVLFSVGLLMLAGCAYMGRRTE